MPGQYRLGALVDQAGVVVEQEVVARAGVAAGVPERVMAQMEPMELLGVGDRGLARQGA